MGYHGDDKMESKMKRYEKILETLKCPCGGEVKNDGYSYFCRPWLEESLRPDLGDIPERMSPDEIPNGGEPLDDH